MIFHFYFLNGIIPFLKYLALLNYVINLLPPFIEMQGPEKKE
jgi:hypothetical protein